jgi:hypothetical protein
MKWFWYSLIGFILLMCSCKTHKSARLIHEVSKETMRTELNRFQLLTDTSNVLKIGIDQSKLKIIETIITKRYDKDTGVITEETTTEREIAQDSNEVVAEAEEKGVTEENDILVKHESDFSKTLDSEEKEESRSDLGMFWEQFGKSLGIIVGIALVVGLIGLYLKKKISS